MKVPTLSKKHEFSPRGFEAGVLMKEMPSWWVTLFAYLLAGIFCYFINRFFLWLPPYLYEVFKNLRGLPVEWANWGMFCAERGLKVIAIVSALYHQFWQIGTRYILTDKEIRIEHWFPQRKVISTPLSSIRRYSYQQNWFGFLLNFGMIEIDTASLSLLVLSNCPKPEVFLALLKSKHLSGAGEGHK